MSHGFCHLHLHTEYSALDGGCKVENIADAAKALGMGAVGISDHGTMSGVPRFYKAITDAGLHPVLGMEAYLTDDRAQKAKGTPTWHLGLIARTTEGYHSLCEISSAAFIEGFYRKPRADWELLERHASGLICLTGCMAAPVMSAIFQGEQTLARERVERLVRIFGADNVYGEIQNVGIVEPLPEGSELHRAGMAQMSQDDANRILAEIAREVGIPLVATGDVHYLKESDATPHDAMVCIGTGQQVNGPRSFSLLPKTYYFRSEEEMRAALPEWPEALANAGALATRCEAEVVFGQTRLPRFPVPRAEQTAKDHLRELCEDGMVTRYGPRDGQTAEQRERLDFELQVIDEMGFNDYFLICHDFFREARERGIPVGPGRGSAAGSIVSYVLGLTQLCPLEYGLLFERFLNPGRKSMPDIDSDFSILRRDELIAYVRDKYNALAGCDTAVSQIITFGTIGAKAGLRDAARVLGHPIALADRLAKMVPERPVGVSLRETYRRVPEFKRAFQTDPAAKEVITLAGWLEGFVRSEGVHAAGVVIWDQPLERALPLVKKGKDAPLTTAYDLATTEKLGLLKMDFLGLKNLDVIWRAMDIVRHTAGVDLDPYAVPLDDAATYAMLSRGEAIGVFQFESSGMRDALRLVRPSCLEDLIALVALYRPGPMAYIPSYAARKHGREAVTYRDARLETILGQSYGIPIYQESLMQTARVLAGFTPAEADDLRKAVGKKDAVLMGSLKPKFISGCAANDVPRDVAEELWDDNERAAEYSFNRSHAACYAYLAYVTAYLKANYPAAYMAALMSLNAETKDKVPVFITEARRMGLTVLAPDINRSRRDFSVEVNDASGALEILVGLSAIKGVGDKVIAQVRAERESRGPVRSLGDLIRRLPSLNKGVLEKLILAGALDSTGGSRRAMHESVGDLIEARRREDTLRRRTLVKEIVAARAEDPGSERPGGKVTRPSAAEKRAMEAVAQLALDGALPAAAALVPAVRAALDADATRLARAAARDAGLSGEALDAWVGQALEAGADERDAQSVALAPQLHGWVTSALDQAPDDDLALALEDLAAPAAPVGDWPERERLNRERDVLGFFASGHPLAASEREWAHYRSHQIADIDGRAIGETVRVVGAITAERQIKRKSGEVIGTELTIEDLSGAQTITFFDTREDWAHMMRVGELSVFMAKVAEDTFAAARAEQSGDDEGMDADQEAARPVKLMGTAIHPWRPEQVVIPDDAPLEVHLPAHARTAAHVDRLRGLFARHPGPSPVVVIINGERHTLDHRVAVGPDLEALIQSEIMAPPAAAA